MALNDLGLVVPAGTDLFDPDGDIRKLGDSEAGRLILPVANTAARNALATLLAPSASEPLWVYRQDAPVGARIEWTVDGATWRVIRTSNRGPVATVGDLPASGDYGGERIYVEDIDAIAWWDQKTGAWQGFWRDYTPTIGGTAAPTLAFRYKITPDEMVEVRVRATLTAGVTTTMTASLPVPAHADYSSTASPIDGTLMYRDTSVGGNALVPGFARYNGADTILFYFSSAINTSAFITSGANPWTWASSDTIAGTLNYRRA